MRGHFSNLKKKEGNELVVMVVWLPPKDACEGDMGQQGSV